MRVQAGRWQALLTRLEHRSSYVAQWLLYLVQAAAQDEWLQQLDPYLALSHLCFNTPLGGDFYVTTPAIDFELYQFLLILSRPQLSEEERVLYAQRFLNRCSTLIPEVLEGVIVNQAEQVVAVPSPERFVAQMVACTEGWYHIYERHPQGSPRPMLLFCGKLAATVAFLSEHGQQVIAGANGPLE